MKKKHWVRNKKGLRPKIEEYANKLNEKPAHLIPRDVGNKN